VKWWFRDVSGFGSLRVQAIKMGNVEMCKTLVENRDGRTDRQEGHVRAGRSPLEVARAQNPGSEGNVLDKQLARILAQ